MKRVVISAIVILLSFFLLSVSSIPAFAKPSSISDRWITAKVKSELERNAVTQNTALEVSTRNGIVTLSGTVAADTTANTAVQITESVDGVKDVDTSNLNVNGSTQPMTDSYITAKVKGILIREKLLNKNSMTPMSIKVETQNGVVYLSGSVDRAPQAKRAEALARSIDGVNQVISTLQVRHK